VGGTLPRPYRRDCKDSSYDTGKSALARFTDDFGNGPIVSITRLEAIDWAERVAAYRLPVVSRFSTPRSTADRAQPAQRALAPHQGPL
jgi:hypothetical protein